MITVLGASGNTGGRVVRRLQETGETVRAVGRDATRLAEAAAHGAEPHVADIADRAALTTALRGADAAYVLMPLDLAAPGYRAQQERVGTAIATALADAGVPRVVALSSLGAERARGTGFLETLHEQEQRLAALDARVLFLRPGLFFESFLPALDAVLATGVHHDTIDYDVALPMVATADVGDAAADALRDPDAEGVRELLGPEDLTVPEAIARLGAALGQPGLRYERPPAEVMRAVLVEVGLPPDLADENLAMNVAFNAGTVRALTGRGPATSTPTTIERWAAALPLARAAQ
ncbi:NmrA family NAD(P)-binding protein [Actinomycetospora sp. CA-101289]|uniref:NmrA family NAD(P)-binding protein n=1 Tax=Actinomycetospora sp. CA-101289 TaxID=3239893 RepID=UPI003D97F548